MASNMRTLACIRNGTWCKLDSYLPSSSSGIVSTSLSFLCSISDGVDGVSTTTSSSLSQVYCWVNLTLIQPPPPPSTRDEINYVFIVRHRGAFNRDLEG